MNIEKLKLELTEREQCVTGIIKRLAELCGEKNGGELLRIRKLHTQIKEVAKEISGIKPPSNCLIRRTIDALVTATILCPVENKEAPGDQLKSVLYTWDAKAFDRHVIVTVKQRAPKKKAKKEEPVPPIVEEVAPEDWYTGLCRGIKDKEAQLHKLEAELEEDRRLKAQVDESIANVRKCFSQR